MTLEEYLKPLDIHEVNHQPIQDVLLTSLVIIGVLLLNVINLMLIINHGLPILIGILLHLGISGLAFLYAKAVGRAGRDQRYALMLAVCSMAIGPFGAVGVFFALWMTVFYTRYSQSFLEWFGSIFPQAYVSIPERVHDNIQTGRDLSSHPYSVIPFLEVMTIGSESQKRMALSRMALMFSPSFAPAFKKALTDSSNSIRVQAATSVTRIENSFLQRTIQINKVVDRFGKIPEVKLIMARHYDDYAYTGVLDPEREYENRKKALEAYMDYLKDKPDDLDARLAVGRLLVRSGDDVGAADWFGKSVNEAFISPSLLIWYTECLYRLGRFKELRKVASEHFNTISQAAGSRSDVSDAIKIWISETVPQLSAITVDNVVGVAGVPV